MVRNKSSEDFRPEAAVPQVACERAIILLKEEAKQPQVLLKKHRNTED